MALCLAELGATGESEGLLLSYIYQNLLFSLLFCCSKQLFPSFFETFSILDGSNEGSLCQRLNFGYRQIENCPQRRIIKCFGDVFCLQRLLIAVKTQSVIRKYWSRLFILDSRLLSAKWAPNYLMCVIDGLLCGERNECQSNSTSECQKKTRHLTIR